MMGKYRLRFLAEEPVIAGMAGGKVCNPIIPPLSLGSLFMFTGVDDRLMGLAGSSGGALKRSRSPVDRIGSSIQRCHFTGIVITDG